MNTTGVRSEAFARSVCCSSPSATVAMPPSSLVWKRDRATLLRQLVRRRQSGDPTHQIAAALPHVPAGRELLGVDVRATPAAERVRLGLPGPCLMRSPHRGRESRAAPPEPLRPPPPDRLPG